VPAAAEERLRRFAAGAPRADALQEIARPNRFAIVAAGGAVFDALRESLAAHLVAPFDTRPSTPLGTMAETAAAPEARWVLTHVDVVPPAKDAALALVAELAEASRSEEGCLGFSVLQQDSRANHMTLLEIWRDEAALAAHGTAAHTRAFRENLLPLQGALYDERIYRILPRG
jgi:quinol monooxygenase YgiN